MTSCHPSNRVPAAIAGADPDRLLDVDHENLAVADAPGAGGILDRLDGVVDHRVLDHHFDFHLGQEVDHIFGAAVEFGMALLPTEALDLGDRDSTDAHLVQRVLDVVELERLDDRLDLLHAVALDWIAIVLMPNR